MRTFENSQTGTDRILELMNLEIIHFVKQCMN